MGAYKGFVNTTPLQSIVDPFVKSAGGEVVAELIEQNPEQAPTQADYFFRRENVILELKALEKPSFGDSYVRKLSDLTNSWVERGMFIAYGTVRVDIRGMHPICQQEWLDVLAEPLQRNVIAKANRQISETKRLLGAETAKGLLWLASDGNLDLQSTDVWFLVSRILGKKTSEGQKQFSGIDGVIYFHPRAPAIAAGLPGDVFLWLADAREADQQVREFINDCFYGCRRTSSALTSLRGGRKWQSQHSTRWTKRSVATRRHATNYLATQAACTTWQWKENNARYFSSNGLQPSWISL